MSNLTRRHFLRTSLAGAGLMATAPNLLRGAEATVVLDVTIAPHVRRDVLVVEFREHRAQVLAQDVCQDVEAAPHGVAETGR